MTIGTSCHMPSPAVTVTRKGYAAECPNVGMLLKNMTFDLEGENVMMGDILDKKEAQKWIETADQRWKKLTSESAKMLDTPVSLVAQQSGAGWGVTFTLADYTAKELFFRLNGAGDFQSTGHLPNVQPQTGRPMIIPMVGQP